MINKNDEPPFLAARQLTLEKYHHFDRIRPVLLGAFLFRQVVNQLADCTSFPFVLCTFGILSVN